MSMVKVITTATCNATSATILPIHRSKMGFVVSNSSVPIITGPKAITMASSLLTYGMGAAGAAISIISSVPPASTARRAIMARPARERVR